MNFYFDVMMIITELQFTTLLMFMQGKLYNEIR